MAAKPFDERAPARLFSLSTLPICPIAARQTLQTSAARLKCLDGAADDGDDDEGSVAEAQHGRRTRHELSQLLIGLIAPACPLAARPIIISRK
jgi:hypothetical protein